jgi:AcrR family transcriptional regulator
MSDAVSRRRGEYSKTARRREEILDAADEVFSRSGFMQASLGEIAEKAGISVAGLNHHFSTKTQLLEALFDRKQRETEALFSSTDPMELLRAAVDLADRGQSDPSGTRFFAVMSAEATSPEHPAHGYFQRRYDDTLAAAHSSFKTLKEKGMLAHDVDPWDAARAYVGLSDGLQIQTLYQPRQFSQAAVLKRLLNQLLTEPL